MGSDWNNYDDRRYSNEYDSRDNRDRGYNDNFNNRDAYEYRSRMENYERDYPTRNENRTLDGRPDRDRRESNRFNDKFKNLFTKRDRPEFQERPQEQQSSNPFGNNMIIYSPKTYRDVKKLIDYLKNREPIIVDLAEIKRDKGQRILDFLSGAIYALDGSMHKISGSIYLLTPDGVNIMVPTELKEKIDRNND